MAYILSVWPSRLESPMQSIEEFDDKTSFFAVYDGQTGGSVPTFCARYLQEEIRRFEIQNITENGEKSDPEFLMLQSAIERAFLGLDDMLRGENYWTQLNEGDISYDNMHDVASLDDAGSMICAVIVRDNRLIIANAGRCRCVISRMHQPFALSKDHTCQEWVERKRVGEAKKALAKAAEGSLSDMNLQNARAPYFTRAIGYMRYKKIYVVRAEHQIVTAKPEVKVVTLKDDIQFIILATRAFWEKVKPKEAVRTANADIVFGISKACRGLQDLYDSKIGKAKANMLIMIIQLPDAVQVQPPGDNIQIEEKPVEFKCRNVVDCVKDPSKWKPFSDKYILARDKDEAELREQIRVATLTSIVYGDDLGPRFRMQSRGDGNEVFQYDDKLKQMCLQRLKNYTARSIDKCKVMSEILAVIEDLFDKDDVESLRGLYYRLDRRYDMDTIYSAVTEICKLLECTRVSLKLCGTPQGSVAGAVLITANGKTFDCEGGGKAGLKTIVEAEELSGITAVVAKPGRTIRYILLLEEEAAFSLLTRRKFEEKQNCVLVSGGGQPDVLTRIMLSKLVQLLHVPAYCMVDCNPSGAGIFCTYKYGSQERAFDNLGLTTSLRLIGLMSQHLPRVKDCCSQLSVRDGTLLKNLLESKHLKEDIPLYEHLVHMKKSGLTAQIESLQTLNGHASVEEYIIEQIELAELQGT